MIAERKVYISNSDALAHPAYDDAIAKAVRRARADNGQCFSVYFDGEQMFVRHSQDAEPMDAKFICIAQSWDNHVVQLRFDGARSEWVRT